MIIGTTICIEITVDEELSENMSEEDDAILAAIIQHAIEENPLLIKESSIKIRIPFSNEQTVVKYKIVDHPENEE